MSYLASTYKNGVSTQYLLPFTGLVESTEDCLLCAAAHNPSHVLRPIRAAELSHLSVSNRPTSYLPTYYLIPCWLCGIIYWRTG